MRLTASETNCNELKVRDDSIGKKKIECIECKCNDKRLLEINHINGGGCKETKNLGTYGSNAIKFLKEIISLRRSTKDLNILCRVCNAKHYLETKYGKLTYKIIWIR